MLPVRRVTPGRRQRSSPRARRRRRQRGRTGRSHWSGGQRGPLGSARGPRRSGVARWFRSASGTVGSASSLAHGAPPHVVVVLVGRSALPGRREALPHSIIPACGESAPIGVSQVAIFASPGAHPLDRRELGRRRRAGTPRPPARARPAAGRRSACRRSLRTTRRRTTACRSAGRPGRPLASWWPCSPATAAGSSCPRCSKRETLNRPSEYENCRDPFAVSWCTSYSCSDAGSSAAQTQPWERRLSTLPMPTDSTPPGAIGGRWPRNSESSISSSVNTVARTIVLPSDTEQLPLQQQSGRLVDPEPRRQRLVVPQRLDQYGGPPDGVRAALVDQLVRRLQQCERSAVDGRADSMVVARCTNALAPGDARGAEHADLGPLRGGVHDVEHRRAGALRSPGGDDLRAVERDVVRRRGGALQPADRRTASPHAGRRAQAWLPRAGAGRSRSVRCRPGRRAGRGSLLSVLSGPPAAASGSALRTQPRCRSSAAPPGRRTAFRSSCAAWSDEKLATGGCSAGGCSCRAGSPTTNAVPSSDATAAAEPAAPSTPVRRRERVAARAPGRVAPVRPAGNADRCGKSEIAGVSTGRTSSRGSGENDETPIRRCIRSVEGSGAPTRPPSGP